MIKLLGNVALLALLYFLMIAWDPAARGLENHRNLAFRIGLSGILSLAAGILIIAGGIDLSIGSTVVLCATAFGLLLYKHQVNPVIAAGMVLCLGAVIGLFHGVMVTVVRIQAFIVTLCGLFIYRGLARRLADDSTVGLGTSFTDLKEFFNGDLLSIPVPFLILLTLLAVLGVLLHFSIHGRYLFAIGSNEKAAEYCGIATTRYKILSYVLCSTLAAGYSMLLLFRSNSVQPNTTGNFLELYAIAAAVIGGCSLRGGDGNVLGMFLGTCIITILPTVVLFLGINSTLEYPIIGGALLLGAVLDETLRRYYRSARA